MWTKHPLPVHGEDFYCSLSLIHGRKHLADIRTHKPCFYISIWQGGLITQSLTWLAVIKSECRSQCLYADTSLEWKSKPEALPAESGWFPSAGDELSTLTREAQVDELRSPGQGASIREEIIKSSWLFCWLAACPISLAFWKGRLEVIYSTVLPGNFFLEVCRMRAWHSLSHCLVVLCPWCGFRNEAECVSEDLPKTGINQFPTPTFYFNIPLKRAKLRVTVLCWVTQGGCGKKEKNQRFLFLAPWRALSSPFLLLTERSLPCLPLLWLFLLYAILHSFLSQNQTKVNFAQPQIVFFVHCAPKLCM